jgi:hypothetical protein
MNRHQHPSNNDVLGAPPGATADECQALPITRVVWPEQRLQGVVSYWMPTAAELALLNAGAAVRLSVLGRTHPPLAVGVDGDGLI